MITIYVYQKCSTCRDALRWLDERNIPYHAKAIRETPPSAVELKQALSFLGGDLKKLFNTSGLDYRAMGMKNKLPTLTEHEALAQLSTHGNLVKRPFILGKDFALTGFKEAAWQDCFSLKNTRSP